jgi:beta-N-acetylhexosaminidase
MSSHSSCIADKFAFLPLCPSGDKTGLIACVGVDKSARGRGVGLGLMVRAMEDMKRRGVEGVLIDVSILHASKRTWA